MKKALLLSFVILLMAMYSSAQVFPFYDDYESYTAFNVPPSYSGNVTVYLTHGTNSSKGLAAFLTSFSFSDSLIFPVIGPVSGASVLEFDWRIVDPFLYPSTQANFINGDKFEILGSTDGINYQAIFSITAANFINVLTFDHAVLGLSSFAGNNLYLKVRGTRVTGSGEFFIDIDNVRVDIPGVVPSTDLSSLQIFPSPSNGLFNFTNSIPMNSVLEVYDMNGKKIKSKTISNETSGSIDLTNFSSGKYQLRIQTNAGVKISDVIKR